MFMSKPSPSKSTSIARAAVCSRSVPRFSSAPVASEVTSNWLLMITSSPTLLGWRPSLESVTRSIVSTPAVLRKI